MPHVPGHVAPRNGNATFKIKKTGEPYNGLVLDWGGRLVTTKTGTYEGQFSQELTAATPPRGRNGITPPGNGNTLPGGPGGGTGGRTRNGNGPPPDITPPPIDGGENQGGGMY